MPRKDRTGLRIDVPVYSHPLKPLEPMTGKRQKTLADLIDMNDPNRVFEEVKNILGIMFHKPSYGVIEQAFADTVRLFNGEYPGYRRCTTPYHDLKHATDTMLAMARLMHGAFLEGHSLTGPQVSLGLMCSLMHDTGYIQKEEDTKGTGAKYIDSDTIRSIEFMEAYVTDRGLIEDQFAPYADIIICTSLEARVDDLSFPSPAVELLCKLLGTADLMAQMADRTYLEKLLYLYEEFREARVAGYTDELDFLKKTKEFYEMVIRRFREEFNGLCNHAQRHFKERWGIDRNLYIEAIESNIGYLTYLLENHEKNYRNHLRRGNVVQSMKRKRGSRVTSR
jgi:hypothetical protein